MVSSANKLTASFKVEDAASYDHVADAFDDLTLKFATPIAQRLILGLKLQHGDRLLDVGTGTGLVALQASEQVGAVGNVTGVDLSAGMLEVLKRKAARLDRCINVICGDAESLPLDSQSFDAVASLYALLHFPSPAAALSEMYRVLRPGGKLAIAIGSGPPWWSFSGWMHKVAAVADRLGESCGRNLSAPRSLVRYTKNLPEPEVAPVETEWASGKSSRASRLKSLLRDAGFVNVRPAWVGRRAIINDPNEFWRIQAVTSSKIRKRLDTASEGTQMEVRQTFISMCEQVLARGGKLVYPHAASMAFAERPDR